MNQEIIVVLSILAGAIILFITDKYSPDVVALLTVLALILSRTLSLSEALAGFANPVVITIAAIFVITAGLTNAGVAARIGDYLFRIAGKNEARLVAVTMGASATLSLVMNNMASASVLLPGLSSITRRSGVGSSKLMIPLSFGTLLGGMATLFTTINLLANDALRQKGLDPFTFWDFFSIGSILSIAGILFMVLLGRKILPDHHKRDPFAASRSTESLVDLYRMDNLLFKAPIPEGSPLDGVSIAQSRLGRDFSLNVIGVLRGRRIRPAPGSGEILRAGDSLVVEGKPEHLRAAQEQLGLAFEPAGLDSGVELEDPYIGIAEMLISPRSGVAGRSLREIHFRRKYGLTALAIMREGKPILEGIPETPLQFGDALLVQGPRARIGMMNEEQDFIVLEHPGNAGNIGRPEKALWALVGIGLMFLLAGFGIVPIATAALVGAVVMILSGVLKTDEGYRAIEWKAVIMVGGLLSLGTALGKSGAADLISQSFLHLLVPLGNAALPAGFFLISMIMAQIISGAATTVLITPIALSAASQMGVSVYPVIMMIVLGASSAFLTPVSHPVNLLVMSPGGYRFSDYARVGFCLGILIFLLSAILVPILWPL
ncbi:MAG: SLC13 family permease [Acidobacteria bacterium]|nr:SLC13 family permease [Acidobacteriota bacterium]